MTMMKFGAVSLALMLVPALAFAAGMEGMIVKVDKVNRVLVVKVGKGDEKALQITNDTKGLENAIEGALVKIEYSRQGRKLMASDINASKSRILAQSAP